MKVVMACSEMVPFAKTGGLADVAGALPKYLVPNGVELICFLPYYSKVRESGIKAKKTSLSFGIILDDQEKKVTIHKTTIPGTKVTLYLVENEEFFNRPELYATPYGDYADNSSRFILFSRAVLETLIRLDIPTDVIHCHDWQSALITVYLKTIYKDKVPGNPGSLLTIHNLAYQGLFWHWDMKLTGLTWEYFNWRQLEYFGKLNFLKGGIVFADAINTVSPTYAKEIQTPEYGAGLEDVLRFRSDKLFGIINGIDYEVWNPETDELIPHKFTASTLAGKTKNKTALQKEVGLEVNAKTPLIGMISRLAAQKGFDLLEGIMDELVKHDVQIVLLGTGEKRYQDLLADFGKRYPEKISANIRFDNGLAHRIEAGSDMFLMPSRYEPCGLNQLYSLKYGTLPIVRKTGGLADTIVDANEANIANKTATGFMFEEYTSAALLETIERALNAYAKPKLWKQLVTTAMADDWSWNRSATDYAQIYKQIVEWKVS